MREISRKPFHPTLLLGASRQTHLVAGAILVASVLLAGCGGPQSSGRTTATIRGWVLVEPPRQGFVVEMPNEPTATSADKEVPGGTLERTVYETQDEDGRIEYYLIRTVYPKGTFAGSYTRAQALSDLRREFVDDRNGGEVERTWFMKMKQADEATMFIFRTEGDVLWRVRQAIRGEVAYQIAYATPDKALRKTGARYLRSFELY